MEKWVKAICRASGLHSTEESTYRSGAKQEKEARSPELRMAAMTNEDLSHGPYIPISECITGTRFGQNPEPPRAFTFDPKNIHVSDSISSNKLVDISKESNENVLWQPSTSGRQVNAPKANGHCNVDIVGDIPPPVPPRPRKSSYHQDSNNQREPFVGPKINEPIDRLKSPILSTNESSTYLNMPEYPPAVNRGLKPRAECTSSSKSKKIIDSRDREKLQYLDLDLNNKQDPISKPYPSYGHRQAPDTESVYRTVDFLKTEAFNITRQDAEASRSKAGA